MYRFALRCTSVSARRKGIVSNADMNVLGTVFDDEGGLRSYGSFLKSSKVSHWFIEDSPTRRTGSECGVKLPGPNL